MKLIIKQLDDYLPKPSIEDGNVGIDLYSREDMMILPSISHHTLAWEMPNSSGRILLPEMRGKTISGVKSETPNRRVVHESIGIRTSYLQKTKDKSVLPNGMTDGHKEAFIAQWCGLKDEGNDAELQPVPPSWAEIPLNVIIKGEKGFAYALSARSSLFDNKGLVLTNSIGWVDPKYQGIKDEIKARVINLSWHPVRINKGEKLFQLIILTAPEKIEIEIVQKHWGTESRGGFGSTGGYDQSKEVN